MKRLELLNALKKVMPGIDEKASALLEGANSFMFDNNWIKSFNDSISVSYPFEIGVKCLVKAKELFSFLNKLNTDEVKIVVLDDGKFRLSSGKATMKLAPIGEGEKIFSLVDNLSLSEIVWQKLPLKFMEALKLCQDFASNNTNYGALAGVSVGKDGLAASDRIRAAFYNMRIKTDSEFVIPIRAVRDLAKMEDLTEFFVAGSWIHFKNKDGLCFSTKKIGTDFPREAIKKMLDFSEVENQEHSFPETLAETVSRVSVLSYVDSTGQEYVEIEKNDKGDMMVTGAAEYGEIKEKISKNTSWEFPDGVKIRVAPRSFVSLLALNKKFYIRGERHLMMKNGNFDSVMALNK